MTRADLLDAIAKDFPGLGKKDLKRVVEAIFDEIIVAVEQGGRVEMRGFGNFETRLHKARMGRNPHTGDTVAIEEKRHVRFKASKLLLKRLNAG